MNQPIAVSETHQAIPGISAGGRHGSWRGYVAGYAAALLLTMAAFDSARSSYLNSYTIEAAVAVLAIGQMLVHLIFFLHINTAPRQRTNILAFLITFVIVSLVVVGSLWIMGHLEANMMPAAMTQKAMSMQR